MAWWLTTGVIATGLLSTLVVYLGIGYAERRGLLDVPGQRRSHQVVTPRGGGIGIVIAVLLGVGLPLLVASDAAPVVVATIGGLLLVALVGWIDDHGGLPARIRFAVHLLASLALALALLWPVLGMFAWLPSLLMLGLIVFITAWSINLHNFMDGINGLLACQAIFVLLVVAILAAVGADSGLAWASLGTAAAVAGFLPWNFPRARVFMGDVGSGALGFLIAAAIWTAILRGVLGFAEALIACSAFVTDASATLLSRMLRGRRWYSAHREHLYQWMARRHASHARVVGIYVGWNLLIVTPLLVGLRSGGDSRLGWLAPVSCYALAVLLWLAAKRQCLRRPRRQGSHASH